MVAENNIHADFYFYAGSVEPTRSVCVRVNDSTADFSIQLYLFTESAVAVCPFYQSIPKNVVEEFERDLVEAYLRLSEGTTVFNYQLAVLHGFAQ